MPIGVHHFVVGIESDPEALQDSAAEGDRHEHDKTFSNTALDARIHETADKIIVVGFWASGNQPEEQFKRGRQLPVPGRRASLPIASSPKHAHMLPGAAPSRHGRLRRRVLEDVP